MIVECKCAVYERKTAELIGRENVQDEWTDFAFDINNLQALRKGIEDGKEETYVYFAEDSFVIDLTFNEVLKLWKRGRNQG